MKVLFLILLLLKEISEISTAAAEINLAVRLFQFALLFYFKCNFVNTQRLSEIYCSLSTLLLFNPVFQCGELCDQTSAFNCRSYTFFPGTGVCRLSGDDNISVGPQVYSPYNIYSPYALIYSPAPGVCRLSGDDNISAGPQVYSPYILPGTGVSRLSGDGNISAGPQVYSPCITPAPFYMGCPLSNVHVTVSSAGIPVYI